nr:MAG TPA: hypothetical protein [Caudoviricetes sp.]
MYRYKPPAPPTPSPPTQNETQNTLLFSLLALTSPHGASTFIPVRRKRQPKGTER